MVMVAMWIQDTDAISSGNAKLLMLFIGLVAVSMFFVAVVIFLVGRKVLKALDIVLETVAEVRLKALPVIASATEIGITTQAILRDTAPKLRTITDNVLEISHTARGIAASGERTFTDANLRTQKQVTRVDGMVTAVLATTAEISESIDRGIRIPARKIAGAVEQAREMIESLMQKAKGFAAKRPVR